MTPALKRTLALLTAILLITVSTWSGYYRGRQMSPPAQFVTAGTVARVPTLPGFSLTWSGTGTLGVPEQMAPGAYLVGPSEDALGCVWQRLRRNNEDTHSVIATGQLSRGAPPRLVTIAATDRAFRLLGGCAFRKVS